MTNAEKNKKALLAVIGKLLITAAILTSMFVFVFGAAFVSNNEMYPRISAGDFILYYRLSETFNCGEVVVYENNGKTVVGRVVAFEGDTVEFSGDGRLIVNGCVQAVDSFYSTAEVEGSSVNFPYEVPQGSLFVLADYRTEAVNDSRVIGAIDTESVVGRMIMTVRRRDF